MTSPQVVPYSDHSSYDELMEFVGVVKPRSVQPIVRSFTGDKSKITSLRCNMSSFDHLLDPTPMVCVYGNGTVYSRYRIFNFCASYRQLTKFQKALQRYFQCITVTINPTHPHLNPF